MQTNSSQAQFVYGVAGSPTPVPAFATGLPVFDDPRPVLTIEFDDAVQLASEKKTDAQQQAKEAREKAKIKQESQRREAEKHEAVKKRAEAEKKESAKKEMAKREQAAKSDAALKQEKERVKESEASKRKNEESEFKFREPDNRERTADAWDRDLPTERPRQAEIGESHQGRVNGAPEVLPQTLRKVLEMRELRERLIHEHGPEHPSIRPLNAALEEFERRQQGPRLEPPRQPTQGRGPQERGPQEQGPRDHNSRDQGFREQPPRGHAEMGSVDELMHTVERLERMIERLANEYHAIKEKDGDDEKEQDEGRDSIRKKIQEMVELRLEFRQRVKHFQLDMMRIELERATMETELFEQSLDAIHAVTVEEILQR